MRRGRPGRKAEISLTTTLPPQALPSVKERRHPFAVTTYRFSRGSQVIEAFGQPLTARRRSLVTTRPIQGERETFLTRTGALEGVKDLDLVVVPCDGSPPYPCKISIFHDSWRETSPGSGRYQRQALARVVPIPKGDQVVLHSLEGEIRVSHPDFIAIGVEDEVYANSAGWVADNLEFLPQGQPV